MAEAVQKTGNDVLRDTYAQKTALRLGVAADADAPGIQEKRLAPAVQSRRDELRSVRRIVRTAAPRPTQHEWWLLRVLLESDDQVEWVAAHLDLAWLPQRRRARNRRPAACAWGQDWPGAAAWLSQPENARWQSLVTEILADSRPIPDAVALVQGSPTREGIVKILRDKDIERRLADLNRQLAAPDLPEAAAGRSPGRNAAPAPPKKGASRAQERSALLIGLP